jgi:hypothetical protein
MLRKKKKKKKKKKEKEQKRKKKKKDHQYEALIFYNQQGPASRGTKSYFIFVQCDYEINKATRIEW